MSPLLLRLSERTAPGETHHPVRVSSRVNRLVAWHAHDFAEIFWIADGRCRHETPAGEEILETGDLRFLRPEVVHRLRPVDHAGFAFFNLAFAAECLRHLLRRLPVPVAQYFPNAPQTGRARLSEPARGELEARLLTLSAEPRDRFHLEWFLLETFHLLCRRRPGDLPADAPDWLIQGLLRASEPEFYLRGTSAVYEACGRSPEHVCRSFQRHLRQTPTAWVNARRLEHARRLLFLSGGSVLEVALASGFENPGHFHALFKRAFGLSPAAYRRSWRVG